MAKGNSIDTEVECKVKTPLQEAPSRFRYSREILPVLLLHLYRNLACLWLTDFHLTEEMTRLCWLFLSGPLTILPHDFASGAAESRCGKIMIFWLIRILMAASHLWRALYLFRSRFLTKKTCRCRQQLSGNAKIQICFLAGCCLSTALCAAPTSLEVTVSQIVGAQATCELCSYLSR